MTEQQFWDALQGLLEALSDSYRDVQRSGEEFPGLFNEAVIPSFLKTLQTTDDTHRNSAVWILNTLRELLKGDGTTTLLEGLQHPETDARRASARALGWLNRKEAVAGLTQALADEDVTVRREATESLGKIMGHHPVADDVIPGLLSLLSDSQAEVRYAAAWALGHSGSDAVVSDLGKMLDDPERNVRRVSARALGWLEYPQAVPALLEALDDSSSGVRRDAAAALGKIGDKKATAKLVTILEDERDAVRYTAAWALGQLDDEAALSGLLRALNDKHGDVRRAAAEALGKIGDVRIIPALHKALREAQDSGNESQVYSIGVVLYEKLTASMPVEAYEFGEGTSRVIDPVTQHEIPLDKVEAARRQIPTEDVVRYIETLIDHQADQEVAEQDAEQALPAGSIPDPFKNVTHSSIEHATQRFTLSSDTGKSISVKQSSVILGRSKQGANNPDIDLSELGGADARTASRRHCRIFRRGQDYFIEDLGSLNGTQVNGEKLVAGEPRLLKDGDYLIVGRIKLTFKHSDLKLHKDD